MLLGSCIHIDDGDAALPAKQSRGDRTTAQRRGLRAGWESAGGAGRGRADRTGAPVARIGHQSMFCYPIAARSIPSHPCLAETVMSRRARRTQPPVTPRAATADPGRQLEIGGRGRDQLIAEISAGLLSTRLADRVDPVETSTSRVHRVLRLHCLIGQFVRSMLVFRRRSAPTVARFRDQRQ